MSFQLAGVLILLGLVGGWGLFRIIKALGRKEAQLDVQEAEAEALEALAVRTVAENLAHARARRDARRRRGVRNALNSGSPATGDAGQDDDAAGDEPIL